VERELAQVNEMASTEGVAHLLETSSVLPPGNVPSGAPLALWFFLYNPRLFDEVFFHHEVREIRSWRVARTVPGLPPGDLQHNAAELEASLRKFFRLGSVSGRFCTVEVRRIQDAVCFAAHVADRARLVEWFTERGQLAAARVRPARVLHFAYHPCDGTILLNAPLGPVERLHELLHCFAQSILSTAVEGFEDAFNLDRLKYHFHPPLDGTDMEMVRVRNLHLRYPAHRGPRQVKLETLSSDKQGAIEEMLRDHLCGAVTVDELRVSRAELQVRLNVGGRSKNYLVRLWPDRCNLSHTPIGIRLWRCLQRWDLCHTRQP
jgi:hypothetical protein